MDAFNEIDFPQLTNDERRFLYSLKIDPSDVDLMERKLKAFLLIYDTGSDDLSNDYCLVCKSILDYINDYLK